MRFASIGIRGALRSKRADGDGLRAGFTLLEALVAMAVLLAFAATLGPHLFHSRRLMLDADTRVAAQVLLRTLLETPFDRTILASVTHEGEAGRLRWRITTEPLPMPASQRRPNWTAFRVKVSVGFGSGQVVAAETMRLGKLE